MIWRVGYAHDRETRGMVSIEVEVEAPDEERAIMRAGMGRAESFTSWFLTHQFYRTRRLQWRRLYVRPVS